MRVNQFFKSTLCVNTHNAYLPRGGGAHFSLGVLEQRLEDLGQVRACQLRAHSLLELHEPGNGRRLFNLLPPLI